jgi:choline dehydrogenase-like flavoprotein
MANPPLSAARRATLEALARIIVPRAFDAPERVDVVGLVEERICQAPPGIARDLGRVLDLFGGYLGALGVARTLRPLAALPPEERARAFEQWGTSSIPVARTAYQAIRQLVLATYYATPQASRSLGLRPPLHTREPEVPWEGPATGERTLDTEPVARRPSRSGPVPGASPEARPIPPAVTLGSTLRGELSLRADVVIVGSGAGGAVAAARFAEAGREVIVLEEGEYRHAPDFTEVESETIPRLFADQAMRATTDGAIALLQGATAGGGTTVNWMLMLRTPDRVLDEWRREHGITDLGPDVMHPELDRIEQEVHARVVPDDAHSPSNRVLLDGARTLGWRARAAAINAAGCVRAGTCALGCRYDAKQSALLTYLPRAFAAGAFLYANVRVERVEIVERSTNGATPPLKRVHATVYDRETGSESARLDVEAPIVILAAGAVGTPAILQRSGLGGGGVGRFLRLHPTSGVMGRFSREMYPMAGVPQTTMCDEFIDRDGNGYGFWVECPGLPVALASAAFGGFGQAHREWMTALANVVPFIVLVRDGSRDEGSQGSVWVDRHGDVRVRFRMGRADRANLAAGVEAAARIQLAAGADEVATLHTPTIRLASERDLPRLREASYAPNRVTLLSAHVNGTCRMGVHPSISGTTPEGERHGVRGLYVLDGSLLPTSLGVNPQETIMALASVLAGRIIAR